MDAPIILTLVLLNAVAYALAFGAATALVEILAGPWRRAAGAHWTERARLASAPGAAVIWLTAMLPAAAAVLAMGVFAMFDSPASAPTIGFWMPWLAAFAGVLAARYRWLRELWGARVTIRSWLAGCLVLTLSFVPHVLVMLLLLALLPDTPNRSAALLLGAGFLAMAFLASGGSVLLLRLLRVVRPAPPHLVGMVEQLAQEMKLPGRVRVLELDWAQVNAVASVTYRAVAFSRPLLAIMSPVETRAIAAHELAHLLEPPWVRVVRVLHLFAYLPAVPLIKYGGPGGLLAGWLLVMSLLLGVKRFTRRMEVRADRLERQAIADPNAYMRSLIKLHEANMVPAVMPGSQTHPHLYDRLLAGGIQPDFPRPTAPSRAKPLLAALAATLATAVIMFLALVTATSFQRLINSSHAAAAVEPSGGFGWNQP
jgi:Zn-dependent protease with chaperone function